MPSDTAISHNSCIYVDPMQHAKNEAKKLIDRAYFAAVAAGALAEKPLPAYVVEVPNDEKNGDLAVNVAMMLAKAQAMPPREIAKAIMEHAVLEKGGSFANMQMAGPGFINLFFACEWYSGVLVAAHTGGPQYGRTNTGRGQRVNVEFVSANPTGPMHLGNARGGALGDCLASTLCWAGYDVTREFYINDAGNQIDKFGRSLAARYLQIINGEAAVPFPEDGYQGEDIKAHAEAFMALHGEEYAQKPLKQLEEALAQYALALNVEEIKQHLAAYRVHYDVWFYESSLHESGQVAAAVQQLVNGGHTYEKDGAVFFKTSNPEEKDEVLVRANGLPTYFAADIAYHLNKFSRGYARLIDAWGADHHGHVARMKEAISAMGQDGGALDVVLFQMVNLLRGGQPVRMSKRTGKAITLSSLLDEVPIDSARFFFNMREPGSTIDFDLDLAVAKDSDNPVYYVQYANARVASIVQALAAQGTGLEKDTAFAHAPLLKTPSEQALLRTIAAFPGEISYAAQSLNPSRITRYLQNVAMAFHRFYTSCHIRGEENGLLQARLALAIACKIVLKNGLELLNIQAPEKM